MRHIDYVNDLHPAVIDALAIRRRELGDARISTTEWPPARTLRAHEALTSSGDSFAPLNEAFGRWSGIWADLAARRPRAFLWHPRRLGTSTHCAFSLAFLYARKHSPKALRHLEFAVREHNDLRRGRSLLRALTGLPNLGRSATHWQFDARCLALRSVPELGPGRGYGAWSYAEEWRLRHQAVFSLSDIRARRDWGGRQEVCSVVLHEETHAAFAAEVSPGAQLRTNELVVVGEEAVTSVFELAAADYMLFGTVPDGERLMALSRGHGYGRAVRSLLAHAPSPRASAAELLGGLASLNLDLLACGKDEVAAARTLSRYAGVSQSPERWLAELELAV